MLLMENRHGLIVDDRVSEANGTAERDEAQTMIAAIPGRHRITVGGDKNFDTAGFVAALRDLNATPHVAQNTSNRRSAIDGRTTRHPGYAVEPADPQADRGGVRLDQGDRPAAARPASRQGAGRLAVHPGGRGLQPDPTAQAAGGRMTTVTNRSRVARISRTKPSQQRGPNPAEAADATFSHFFRSLLVGRG